ncbi:P-loop containing nucleoside triphosphate hydrolase protein [Chlamydoabsidia padenii]|nr:P-loop containing nucleoside triphosphate hydrolase protein [Chlamydoabsidia padenii]
MTKPDPSPCERIKIVCRIRPFLDHETDKTVVRVNDKNSIVLDNKKDPTKQFVYNSFSFCYPPTATQTDIFDQDVQPLIDRALEGYDTTIFAYGVTGSGKTYTMEGIQQEPGIIPKVVDYLFTKKQSDHSVRITMSYMQILKETVYDMLVPKHKTRGLEIREDSDRNVFVDDLTQKPIDTYSDFKRLFSAANKNRSTASTNLNAVSSRSHAILTLNVETSRVGQTVVGKINLIDLAGSEDNRKSGNGKVRIAESAAINKSLFVLGQVVEALNSGSMRVPFRDSKMTRILQPTLRGNALAMMIINLAPGYSLINDTTNTLNFAHRTKGIVNTPKANVVKRTRPINNHPRHPVPSNHPPVETTQRRRSIVHKRQSTTYALPVTPPPFKKQKFILSSPAKSPANSPSWTYTSSPCLSSPVRILGHYRNESPSMYRRSLRDAFPTGHDTTTSFTSTEEETVTMTRRELDRLRDQWMAQGKQELLSRMYGSS